MAVVAAWTPAGAATIAGTGYQPIGSCDVDVTARGPLDRLAAAARACSVGRAELEGDRWVARGDPMEAALDTFARRLGAASDVPVTRRFPFDARRRRMSVVVGDELVVKGAPRPSCRSAGDAATPSALCGSCRPEDCVSSPSPSAPPRAFIRRPPPSRPRPTSSSSASSASRTRRARRPLRCWRRAAWPASVWRW